jgi:hypothetical protein
MRITGTALAGGLAALTLLAGAGTLPALAAPVDSGEFEFTNSSSFDDCGPTVDVEERIWGTFVIKDSTPRTDGQFFMAQQQLNGFVTFTNQQTGDYFTAEWRTRFTELPATPTKDDPDVVTYRSHETGVWQVLRDSSGKVRYRDTGNVVVEYTFDTLGDSQPGGEILSEDLVQTSGRFDTFDADFCEVVLDLIG